MAKTKHKQKKAPLQNSFLTLDDEKVPIIGMWGRSPETTYPHEFALIDSLKIYQSAVFATEVKKKVDAIRFNLHKRTKKRFVIKKVGATQSRIWRVEDNAKIHAGGRVAGVSPYKRKKELNNQP